MILWRMQSLLLWLRYYTPLSVDEITLIREVIACLRALFLMLSISRTKSNRSVSYILKISRRMSSYTRFFRSYGAILQYFSTDLKCIDSQTKQDFNHSFNVFVVEVLFELLFVFNNDAFGKKLSSFKFSLVDNDFVVLAELDFVVLNRLSDVFVLWHLLKAIKQLQDINTDWEYLTTCLENLLILFIVRLSLFFKPCLLLSLRRSVSEELNQARFLLAIAILANS